MMQTDEINALAVLDRFQTILEQEMAPYDDGQIVQYYGDGCLLAFESALHSVRASMALQRQFIEQEVPVRIGIHLGDVVFVNDNVFGDGVNVASRVESLGVPGAILLSKTVKNLVSNKTEFTLTSVGSFHFKNITEPMEVFAVANPGFVVPEKEQMQGKLKTPTTPQPSSEDRREWEKYQMLEILDALEEQKCVLILGNYAFSKPVSEGEGGPSELFLPELLAREQHKWIDQLPPDSSPDFYTSAQALINRPGGQRRFRKIARIQLDDLAAPQLERFARISEIPFDLILSTYPYDLVHEVFEHNNIPHQYAYYSYLQEPSPLQPFSPEYPLLYNLFGSVQNKESMVVSLDRLYQFIFGILGVHKLPKLIQDKLRQASHLVFLGFSFDDWYMKLLLRVLEVHEKEIAYAHPPGASGVEKQNRQFFESNFKMTFLDKKIDDFVSGLHALCVEEELLRKGNPAAVGSSYENLQTSVDQHRLGEVLEQLDDLILKNGKNGSFILQLGEYQRTYNRIREWEQYDRLSKEELEKEWQGLRDQLSLFIERVSESIFT